MFFSGTGRSDIALAPTIAADANKIATGRADAQGLVHPGDGTQAQALAGLRSSLLMGGGTSTFSDFIGTTIGTVGSRAREADDAVDRQTAALGVVQNLQQQSVGRVGRRGDDRADAGPGRLRRGRQVTWSRCRTCSTTLSGW